MLMTEAAVKFIKSKTKQHHFPRHIALKSWKGNPYLVKEGVPSEFIRYFPSFQLSMDVKLQV